MRDVLFAVVAVAVAFAVVAVAVAAAVVEVAVAGADVAAEAAVAAVVAAVVAVEVAGAVVAVFAAVLTTATASITLSVVPSAPDPPARATAIPTVEAALAATSASFSRINFVFILVVLSSRPPGLRTGSLEPGLRMPPAA